ncbi:hypothetical protein [Mycolicibacterium brisbanense]
MSLTAAIVSLSESPEYEPHTWIGLIPHLAYALPTAISAGVGGIILWGQRKGKERWQRDRQVLDDIHKQAVNDHPESENMRDQLDRMEATQKRHDSLLAEMNRRQVTQGRDIGGLREDVGAVRDDVGGLRGELRDDRGNLRDLEGRINGWIRREHPGADPL